MEPGGRKRMTPALAGKWVEHNVIEAREQRECDILQAKRQGVHSIVR